ncbi:MAG: ABC transporter ATP-binding protein [Alphaproteobacteria bacterium]
MTDSDTDVSAPSGNATPALELRGIDKWFGPVHANNGVSFQVPRGSIHGIIGENGAGKSTLMSIVYGYYQADAGEIRVNGNPVKITGPQNALSHGIGMVHQHFMLVEPFTVLENVILGAESGRLLAPSLERARAELERLERNYALEVNPDATIETLPVGLRQRVEILKALYRGADILILDEPTGVLTPQEVDQLFDILRALRDQGKTVILITHKLREIMALTDNVTVMRQGAVVANVKTAETSRAQLAELMVGRSVLLNVEKTPATPGEEVLAVKDLGVRDGQGVRRVKGVSFNVRAGEILGIAGVAGNGQSELLEALAGIRPIESGIIRFKGTEIDATHLRDAREMRRLGMGHVPEDRQRMGLVVSFQANESSILGHQGDAKYTGAVLMRQGAIVEDVAEKMERFDVRPSNPLLRTSAFSGGNQQKIVLAREMDQNPDLLLVGQPTRGVDIGAIEFIHKRLIAMRDQGKAVLLVSVELDEILSLSDRIVVMFDGEIVGEVSQAEADERKLGLMMAGERLGAAA